jgi:hypothetical protein
VKPDRLLERSRKESVVERQADQYRAGGESTTTTSVAAGDGGWTPERTTIVGGLLVGVVLGMAGNVPQEGWLQNLLYAVSSIGLVVASALLVLREARRGADLVAAGFAIFTVAEIIVWVSGGPTGPGGDAPFAAATLFYAPALLLISVPLRFAFWARAAGALAAVPFGIHAVVFLLGGNPSEVLQIAGYLLLSVAVIGWAVDVVRSTRHANGGRGGEAPGIEEQRAEAL